MRSQTLAKKTYQRTQTHARTCASMVNVARDQSRLRPLSKLPQNMIEITLSLKL